MQNRISGKMPLRVSVLMAMLSAISIICGKYLAFGVGNVLRFSFENLPIIFASVALGPIPGMLVGIVADLVGCLMVGYTINPLVTLGAAAIGGLAWVGYRITKGLPVAVRCAVAIGLSHAVGSVIIKTVGLAAYYDMPIYVLMAWRLLNYAIVGALEGVILYALMKNSYLARRINSMLGRNKNATRVEDNAKNVTHGIEEALEYIHSVNRTFCSPGLERTLTLTEKLGSPERGLKFIHVAGTNGKGSTSCMLESILREAGYKTGLYTSPFIYRFNERIRVMGEEISDEDIIRLTSEIKPLVEEMADKPTEFELITAMAFKYFKECGCDVVVLEVGMGGRFDATNIISSPLISVITGISVDHTAYLGDTVGKIAYEKAGIIKRGVPVVYGGDSGEGEEVVQDTAEELCAEYLRTDPTRLNVKEMKLSGTRFDYRDRSDMELSLLGTYQTRNAMTVLDTVDRLKSLGLEIPEEAVRRGMASARWKARFEILSKNPTVIYDGAHNPEGIGVAVDSIKRYYGGSRVTVISGVLRDKDYRAVAKMIAEVADKVYTITPDSPRALSAEEYRDIFAELGVTAEPMPSVTEAVAAGYERALSASSPLFSLGSLYTYREFTDALSSVRNK